MGSRRSLRFLLFAFDALRLVAVVSALSALRSLFSPPGGGSLGAHAIAFAAPQALFPLMALFSWLDPVRYAPYSALYAAGKAISVVSIGAWLVASAQDALMAIGLGNTLVILFAAVSAIVLFYDLLSAVLAIYLVSLDAGTGKEGLADAAGKRPPLVVETVPDTMDTPNAPEAEAAASQGGV